MKPKVVMIYGPIGVGKLTTARLLSEKTNFPLCHNHLVNDLVQSLFERGTVESSELYRKIQDILFQKAIFSGKSFILTHAYAHNYIYPDGESDHNYMKNLQKKITEAGADMYFIHLRADDDVILERVKEESRKEFRKLTDENIMKNLLEKEDFKTSANVNNQLILDTSNLPVEESVEKILNFILK